jgi:hypothetical protein
MKMKRVTGRVWLVVVGMAIALVMVQIAVAQRGEGGRRGGRGFRGRGGFFGQMNTVRLASAEDVQDILGLSGEQKDKVEQINDELRQARRELFGQGLDFPEMRAEMQKLNDEAAADLSKALDDAQNKRLLGILAQVNVDAALSNPAIAKELNITDKQEEEIVEVRRENRRTRDDAMQELRGQDLSREEIMAKIDDLRSEASKNLLGTLTKEQQSEFEALKGEPVKIDMAQFRFGGRRGRGGEGRPGRRGNRNRDNGDAAQSDRGA